MNKRLLAVLVTVGALTGCTSGNGTGATEPRPALSAPPIVAIDVPVSGYAAFWKSPLAVYEMTDAESDAMWTAMRNLRISCMHQKNFPAYTGEDMVPVDETDAPVDEALQLPAGPWGFIGAQNAAVRGFSKGPVTNPVDQPVTLPEKTLAQSRLCFDAALARLTPPQAGSELVRELRFQAGQAAQIDPRVAAARTAWAGCMTAAGVAEKDPAPLADRKWRANPEAAPSAEELRVAVAAERCTRESGLAAVFFAAQWGYERQLIDRNAAALTEFRAQVRDRVDEAARIVAAGAS